MAIILIQQTAFAQLINSSDATPSVISEPGASLLITEVNFKNSEFDWVKMHYLSPSDKIINLKGITFEDDSKFKTIEENIYIASEQELLLSFKSELPDQIPHLYSERSGLTGTTEQFIIYDNLGNVVDAVCWTSSSPTNSEIKDMSDLYGLKGWNSPDPSSCIFSEDISKNESIIRVNLSDTNSSADWKTEKQINNAREIKIINTEKPSTSYDDSITVAPLQEVETNNRHTGIQEPNDNKPIETTIPDNVKKINLNTDHLQKNEDSSDSKIKKTSKDSNSDSYYNGDLSDSIIISEILPNPEGTDTKKEWIEICNKDSNKINLGNWTIDDIEGGSKPYKIPSSISLESGTCKIFESKDTGLSLGNSEDEVHLFDYNGKEIDSVNYESAPSGESHMKIIINKEDNHIDTKWIWNKDKSPGQANPQYQEITLEVTEAPSFEDKYYFKATDRDSKSYFIEFSEDLIAAPMAQATFTKETVIKTLCLPVEEKNDRLILKQYEVIQTNEEVKKNPLLIPLIIALITLVCISAFYLLKNKIPWQDIKEKNNQQNE